MNMSIKSMIQDWLSYDNGKQLTLNQISADGSGGVLEVEAIASAKPESPSCSKYSLKKNQKFIIQSLRY